MNANRIWGLVTALVIVLILGLGWLLGVQPQLAQAAAADDERVGVEGNNAVQQVVLDGLKAKAANVEEFTATLTQLRGSSIPALPDRKGLLVHFERVAGEAGVQFAGATLGVPTLYAVAPEGAVAPAPQGHLATMLYSMTADLTIQGTTDDVLDFVTRLQTSALAPGRLVIVPAISLPNLGDEDESVHTFTTFVFFIDDPNVPASVTEAPIEEPALDEAPVTEESEDPAPTPTTTP